MRKAYGYLLLALMAFFAVSCSNGGGGGGVIVPTPTGTATLAWTAPATNDDGTAISGLAGFKVHYGISSGLYTHAIDVGNVTTYKVTNLSAGATYYFVVTAYNLSGVESAPSSEVNKKI